MRENIIKVCVAGAVLASFYSVANACEIDGKEEEIKSIGVEESGEIAADTCKDTENMVVTIKSVKHRGVRLDFNIEKPEDSSPEGLSDYSPADTYGNADEKKHGNEIGKIAVTIVGIKSQKGRIRVSLLNLKDVDSDKTGIFKQKHLRINGKSVKAYFKDIPAGEYAISVFHDENKNKKLDKIFFDIPEEGYAFSTNYMDLFDSPEFEDIKFLVEENKVYEDEIKLIYNF